MELSSAIGSIAVVLGVVVAAGFAAGEDTVTAPAQKTAEKRSLEEHKKRREHFERACNKPLKSDVDRENCRAAYRAL